MPWVYVWWCAIKWAYVWWCAVKCIYVWGCKVRPSIRTVEWLLVGWGWAWGRSRNWAWWWGWAWWLIYCSSYDISPWSSCCIVVWAGWIGGRTLCNASDLKWGDSCFGAIVAYGGWGWGGMLCSNNWCPWWDGWSWGGSSACNLTTSSWCPWQWNSGWPWCQKAWAEARAWGWGGFRSAWCDGAVCQNGWCWIVYSITGSNIRYAAWGWGGWYSLSCSQWWGCGWCFNRAWCSATCYGSWWGGGWMTQSNSCCVSWWCWKAWIFVLRYPTSCWYDITGGCKYTSWTYTVHCFTSNGTLTIN